MNEIYLPLTSTVVLERIQGMLLVLLDFENNHTIDAMVDSRAYVSAITRNELHRTKHQAPNNVLEIDNHYNFQKYVGNSQLENPLARTTLKFEIGDNMFAVNFVVMKKFTRPIKGWHFMRNNSAVIDTTHGVIHWSHLTIQVKTTSNEPNSKPQTVFIEDALTIPPRSTKTITALVDHPSDWNTTVTVSPLEKFEETASLLISHSITTQVDIRSTKIESSNQSNQYNGISIFNQKEYTKC